MIETPNIILVTIVYVSFLKSDGMVLLFFHFQKQTQDTDEPSSIRMFNKEENRANGDFDTVGQSCIKESDDANKHSVDANKSKRIKVQILLYCIL